MLARNTARSEPSCCTSCRALALPTPGTPMASSSTAAGWPRLAAIASSRLVAALGPKPGSCSSSSCGAVQQRSSSIGRVRLRAPRPAAAGPPRARQQQARPMPHLGEGVEVWRLQARPGRQQQVQRPGPQAPDVHLGGEVAQPGHRLLGAGPAGGGDSGVQEALVSTSNSAGAMGAAGRGAAWWHRAAAGHLLMQNSWPGWLT